MKGNDFMNKRVKEIMTTLKDNLTDVKDSIVEFGEDTMDYLEDHTWVIPVIGFGALKLIGIGVDLAQKGNLEVRKDGVSEIYTNKFTKLNRKMSFDEWFDYLDEMYKCKFKTRKQVSYLKEKGFID